MITLKTPDLARRFTTPLVAAFLAALLIGAVLWQHQQPQPLATMAERMAPVPASPEIEAAAGIRITQVALIAADGLVDLTYVVVDPDKATLMGESLDRLPMIVAGDGTILDQRGNAHRHGQNLQAGQTHFLLYTNTRGVLRPGDRVTVRVGDLSLAQVPVR
jgi:hypothetical protein